MEADDGLEKATQRAQSAVDGRLKLLDLDKKVMERLQAALRDENEASSTQADAEMNAILADGSERAVWSKKAETAAANVMKAQREQAGVKALQERLPTLHQSADDEIAAAADVFQTARQAAFSKSLDHFAAQVRDVVVHHLAGVLQLGHALSAAGVGVGSFLTETRVPNPRSALPFIGTGVSMQLKDAVVVLRETWRSNPTALAAYDALAPYLSVNTQLESQMRRIREDQAHAVVELNRLGHKRAFDPQFHRAPVFTPLTLVEMETIWLQASGGIPLSAADPGLVTQVSTWAPDRAKNQIEHEARMAANKAKSDRDIGSPLQETIVPLDISGHRTEPLTEAEKEKLWLQVSEGIPWPASDDVLLELLGRYRDPWKAQWVIEREARAAVIRAKRDSNLGATTGRSFPQPGTTVTDGTVRVDVTDDGFDESWQIAARMNEPGGKRA